LTNVPLKPIPQTLLSAERLRKGFAGWLLAAPFDVRSVCPALVGKALVPPD